MNLQEVSQWIAGSLKRHRLSAYLGQDVRHQ